MFYNRSKPSLIDAEVKFQLIKLFTFPDYGYDIMQKTSNTVFQLGSTKNFIIRKTMYNSIFKIENRKIKE